MPSLVFGPTARLAGTVPPTAAEPQTQEGLLCLLLCLAGQEHNLDFPASLILLVKQWKDKTRNVACIILCIIKTVLLQPPRELRERVCTLKCFICRLSSRDWAASV